MISRWEEARPSAPPPHHSLALCRNPSNSEGRERKSLPEAAGGESLPKQLMLWPANDGLIGGGFWDLVVP